MATADLNRRLETLPTYEPYSCLASLLRRFPPQSLDERGRSDATHAVTSLSLGVAVVGRLLTLADARELSPEEIHRIGDFLATCSETVNELWNLVGASEMVERFGGQA